MRPIYVEGQVRARCPTCGGAVTTFEINHKNTELGLLLREHRHNFEGGVYNRTVYRLLRCAGCGRGGLADLHDNGNLAEAKLGGFHPVSIGIAPLPSDTPKGILAEFREAEVCSAHGAMRAASALFRSTLEKTLRANGYDKGNLKSRIDDVAKDGVITNARRLRAHDDVRVLGNDVLHDEWREIANEEVEAAHHYVQRILEDFYDDRASVETILVKKERVEASSPEEHETEG